MESWASYALPSDSFTRSSKNPFMNWESRGPPSFVTSNSIFTSSQQVNPGQALGGSGFVDAPRKQILGDSIPDALHGRMDGGRDANGSVGPSVATADGFLFGEEESSSKLSGCVVDQSPLIDLKLGRLADQRDSYGSGLSRGAPMLSSSESSTPSKRCRAAGVSNQAAYCQVYGCNKDLSSSKDYHKRHKVCEVHSKTPKVIVSGIEQRFCQQCSRFHLLCEFDDGKRSCRKRLAGHNERRRKPQVGFHSSGRAGRFLLPYDVGKFHGMNDCFGHIKLEGRTNYSPIPLSSFQYQDLHQRLPFSSPSFEKGLSPFQESDRDSLTAVNMFGNITRCSGPRPFLNEDPSIGSEEFGSIFNTEPPIQGLSGISEPGCALSLLSSQSQNSSSHTSGIPMDQSLSQYSIIQVSDNLAVNGGSSKLPGSVREPQAGPGAVSDGDSAGFEMSDEILNGSGFSKAKDHFLGEEAPTIDLLQLSSQLQRVEHERQYMKLESDPLVCLRTA
ncbi:squamosa promoter-binding-like protein 6 [Punica granatum]|uniref:SBP-type domain-containing protein n=2 Tax=Punica granatum TaxID=22663 RepID=A0A218VY21_PUNGR|nr:squamosa promoter-binding-like protein 6 [Punica granatum]OWM65213.1 hypothetical protein CDL15_Pgr008802 [Punica granatum]PKI47710.1 hypothetical protein CRG98_031843 [Punica granatum]